VAPLQQAHKPRGNGHHRGHRAQCQRTHRFVCRTLERLPQQFLFMQHALGRDKDLFPFGRKTLEGTAALDDGGSKLHFQRTNRVGQGRLRNVAGLRRTPEMLVLVQRHQVME